MRNLKKFLALVLALMMTFSLMVTANAAIDTDAAVTDKDSITEEFKEAVAVLNGLKIITGYEDSTFRPDKPISRQEAAALVYRLHSGDADNVKKDLYSTADNIAKFKDVNPNGAQQWSAGYIGYCANQEIIKGVGADRFNPTGNVTGYQMLAMVLRAIGYGQNGEYEGCGWQTRVATTATKLGMLKNIDDTNYAGTLSAPATRELVAEIVFQAALLDQVIWNDAFGYVSKNQITGLTLESLGVEKFDLKCSTYRVIDKWGRPGYYWFQGSTVKSDLSNVVATIKALPVKTYDTTVRECDVAHDLDIATNATYRLYVNRNTAITNNYRIEATDTVTKVGGQGRVTEFYGDLTNPHVAGDTWSKSVVMIDTYLATVTKVTERVVDPAGHVIVPAYLYLDVHDGQAVGAADKTDGYEPASATDTVTRNTSEHVASNKDANWEYSVGDKLLIQGYTDYTQRDAYQPKNNAVVSAPVDANIDNGSGLNHLFNNSVEAANKAAFETNILGTDDSKINIVQKSNPVLGKQTVTYWNQGKHTVDGKDYNDAMTLFLDVAGTTTNTTFAWYFDTKGNLIGIDNVPNTVNYGVITSIWTSFNQGETNTDGTAKTYAKVLYADGSEATITIDRFLVTQGAAIGTNGHVAPATAGTAGVGLTIGTTANLTDTAELIPVYDYNGGTNDPLTMAGSSRTGTAKDAHTAGYLHVAPVASINDAQDQNADPSYGIIKGNLFKFEASANGETTVIEVAGNADNEGKFVGHYYTKNDDNSAANKTGKLFKNLGCMSVDGGSHAFAWLDSNTRIMLNDGSDDEKVSCYTLSTLPGDVLIEASSEIDWADTNNDGRVDVVYLTGTIEGTTTYNLFYYNGGAAQWNGADKKGTLFGWLNGEPATVTFDDEAELNAVKNSQGYAGHLFALQLTNGVVSNVMGVNQAGANDPDIYLLTPTAGTPIVIGTAVKTTDSNMDFDGTNGIAFKTGKADGNPYTATTSAVYIADVAPDTTAQSVSYNPDTRTVIAWTDNGDNSGTSGDGIMQAGEVDDTYYLVPNSKVIGLGMGVNQESAILDYLNKSTTNDVTIVYEITGGNMKSIVEIYVATDPNVTPGGEVTVDPGKPGYGVTALTNISGGISDADLTAAIKGVGPNSVVYSPYASTNVAGAQNKAPQFLYFPFVGEAGNTAGAALTIYKNGVPVFQENETGGVAGAKYFVINFASGTSSNTTITSGPLTAGTYTFKIVSNGTGATLSSGTFVMN